ncbi:MAG TPA: DedA family protein [Miltoncostaeaceae bacterium]|nr:DedA family protein [Miltoncostaeaceae bacterium]
MLAALSGAGSIVQSFADIAESAADYGYWAVLLVVAGDGVFPALPGETAIVAAAVLAANGNLNILLVILSGAVGAMIGDSTAYWIGRAGGGPIKRTVTRFAGRERLEAAERMVARQGPALVVVGRFLPGIRIAINLSCGAGQMSYPRFFIFDSIGAIVWSTQAALLGYFAGKAFADQLWVAFLVAFAVTALVGGFVALKERKRVRQERAAAEAERRTTTAPGEAESEL